MARLFRVVLQVPSMEPAVTFYRSVLGITGESIDPTRYYFHCGGTILALVDPSEHGGKFRPNPDLVYFAVPDLERVFERAVQAGAKALPDSHVGSGIQTRPWGERTFYVSDPFGNPLCFVDDQTLFTGSAKVE